MARGSKAKATDETRPFEEILGRLEQVVEKLEGGELPLEESLAIFEEGVRLSRAGAQRLDAAERRVEELLATSEGLKTVPLEENDHSDAKQRSARSGGVARSAGDPAHNQTEES